VKIFNRIWILVLCVLLSMATAGEMVKLVADQQDGGTPDSSPKMAAKNHDFTLVRLGDGIIDGVRAQQNTYKAADGEMVWLVIAHFRSAEDATRASQERIQKAAEVVKKEPISDATGIIGQRAVIKMTARDRQKKVTVILISKGTDFEEILSYSTDDALAFEKQIRP
jgi:hypothetical protein